MLRVHCTVLYLTAATVLALLVVGLASATASSNPIPALASLTAPADVDSAWSPVAVVSLPIVKSGFTALPTRTPTPSPARLRIAYLNHWGSDEVIAITNDGGLAQSMTGWRIQSVVGNQWYDFPPESSLAAGATVRVHSGPDALSNPPSDLRWGPGYIWNDAGDKAILYNAASQVVDAYCYGSGCP